MFWRGAIANNLEFVSKFYIQYNKKQNIQGAIWSSPPSATDDDGIQYDVDLCKKTCGCRTWKFTGLPCTNVMATVRTKRANPEDFVDCYFLKQAYLMCHGELIC